MTVFKAISAFTVKPMEGDFVEVAVGKSSAGSETATGSEIPSLLPGNEHLDNGLLGSELALLTVVTVVVVVVDGVSDFGFKIFDFIAGNVVDGTTRTGRSDDDNSPGRMACILLPALDCTLVSSVPAVDNIQPPCLLVCTLSNSCKALTAAVESLAGRISLCFLVCGTITS